MKQPFRIMALALMLSACQTGTGNLGNQNSSASGRNGCKADYPLDLPSLEKPPIPVYGGKIEPLEKPVRLAPVPFRDLKFSVMASMETSIREKMTYTATGRLSAERRTPDLLEYKMDIENEKFELKKKNKLIGSEISNTPKMAKYRRNSADWVETVTPFGAVNKSQPTALALGGLNIPLPTVEISQGSTYSHKGEFQQSSNLIVNVTVAGETLYGGDKAVVLTFAIEDPCGFRKGGGYELVSTSTGRKLNNTQTTWVREHGIISAITWIRRDLVQ